MSMSDPIADLLNRIRNGLQVGRSRVDAPASRLKEEICRVLRDEGYIEDYRLIEDDKQNIIQIVLKYNAERRPAIRELRRVSRPSLRQYKKSDDISQVRSGLGVAIVTTSRGVMTGKQARRDNVGGEIICEVW